MSASILAILAGGVSIVLWFLNNTPARRHERLLTEIRKLKDDLAKALDAGDADAVAVCNKRLRDLQQAFDSVSSR